MGPDVPSAACGLGLADGRGATEWSASSPEGDVQQQDAASEEEEVLDEMPSYRLLLHHRVAEPPAHKQRPLSEVCQRHLEKGAWRQRTQVEAGVAETGRGLRRFRWAARRVMEDAAKKRSDHVSLHAVATRAKRRFLTSFNNLGNKEEQVFLSSVLHALPIMLKETIWMRGVYDAMSAQRRGPEQSLEPKDVMDLVAGVLHQIKTLTARYCWSQVLEPLRQERHRLEEQYTGLKAQFFKAREAYLVELSALRDQLRGRGDPEKELGGSGDITLFFDPAVTLTETELSFVSKVVKEKLKMIMEVTPGGRLNLDQLASMEKQVGDHEAKELKAALARQIKAKDELQEKLAALQAAAGGEGVAASRPAAQQSLDGMVNLLEAKVESLRSQLRASGVEEMDALRAECAELREAYAGEHEERMSVQRQLAHATAHAEAADAARRTAEARIQKAEERAAQAVSRVEDLKQEIRRLQAALDDALRRGQPNAAKEDAPRSAVTARQPLALSRRSLDPPPDWGESGLGGSPKDRSEANPIKLARHCAALERDVETFRLKCEELQSALDSARQDSAKRAMAETAHLVEISRVVEVLAETAKDGATRMRPGSPGLSRKQAVLDGLLEQSGQLAAELERCAAEPPSAGQAQRLDEMELAARHLEFSIFMAEVEVETARWAEEAGEIPAQVERESSSRALLQRITVHCERLTKKVEQSVAVSLNMCRAVGELQTQTLATVAKMRASDAVQQDPELTAEVSRLEQFGTRDLALLQHSDEVHGEETVFQRLFRKVMSEAWQSKQKVIEEEALARWLPSVRLAADGHKGAPPSSNLPCLVVSPPVGAPQRPRLRGKHTPPDPEGETGGSTPPVGACPGRGVTTPAGLAVPLTMAPGTSYGEVVERRPSSNAGCHSLAPLAVTPRLQTSAPGGPPLDIHAIVAPGWTPPAGSQRRAVTDQSLVLPSSRHAPRASLPAVPDVHGIEVAAAAHPGRGAGILPAPRLNRQNPAQWRSVPSQGVADDMGPLLAKLGSQPPSAVSARAPLAVPQWARGVSQ